ncbi:Gfo/Idh/MocA family oxidoreductase [Candidatus Bathyarchaeota archaeon]|nr:Gfo/Idh/MocA family oxidoreductase [Candidatus Bathyarchaeota archaeon]
MLQLGIVGCGTVTRMFHLKAIEEVKEFAIAALVDRDRGRLEGALRSCRAWRGYENYMDLLSNPEVHVVVINTPPRYHEEMTIQALRAGKHVLCEKPLATSLEGALNIKLVRDETSLVVLPVHNYSFTPCWELAKGLSHDGKIGDVEKVQLRFENNLRLYRPKTGFRFEKEYGIIEDLLPHLLHLTHELAGRVKEIEEVDGWRESYNVVDNMRLIFRTEMGVRVECFMSWTRLIPQFKVGIIGSKGVIKAELFRAPYNLILESEKNKKKICMRRGLGQYLDLLRMRHPSFVGQYLHLYKVIMGEEEPRIDLDDEIEMIKIMKKIEDISKENKL